MAAELPDDIRAALVQCAKNWLLTSFVGGKVQLQPWSGNIASLVSVHSFDLPGSARANLRRLSQLVEAGVLVERRRSRTSAVRSFKPQASVLAEIGAQAVREWQEAGYMVGVMMWPIGGE